MNFLPLDPPTETGDRQNARLNSWVAITVALLATLMGVCRVKDDNIVQEMLRAQATKTEDWSFYATRNTRQEIAEAALAELTATHAPGAAVARYDSIVKAQTVKKDSLRAAARFDQTLYDKLEYRDDQFDLSDTLIALAISLLALTSLTHKRWLYWLAMIPTTFGVLMGLAGLLGWSVHPNALSRLLS